ncbi:hypothetical protein M501DRAFT_1010109 [Patellaria atrata CBS 101060]|uniref:Secreted protein n=1 Tax=Patellaria atrata CBS 101060 TaxID=1346257 RepID=A0A9P4SE54_9PEZI|nr:hypothetical protein M501DRAFT_1010109 [Patellaria atrata CBS 101060]
MKFIAAAALAAPALVAALPAPGVIIPGVAAPEPSSVKIRAVTYGGTGCPQGTVGSIISSDQSTMTLIFDSYVASIGKGVSVTDNRKNCQINVDLTYPGGFQYSVFGADYRGYAALDAGITGTLKSTYYFSGQTEQTYTQADFKGPLNGDYLKHDEAEVVSVVWSPCGTEGMLNINSQVRLTSTNSAANGLLTTDSIDAKFTQKLYMQWQTCK